MVTDVEDGTQEVMGESRMKARFSNLKDAENKGFKVEHHFGCLSIDESGTVWGLKDSNYPNFIPKGEPTYDEENETWWSEMEFIPDEK